MRAVRRSLLPQNTHCFQYTHVENVGNNFPNTHVGNVGNVENFFPNVHTSETTSPVHILPQCTQAENYCPSTHASEMVETTFLLHTSETSGITSQYTHWSQYIPWSQYTYAGNFKTNSTVNTRRKCFKSLPQCTHAKKTLPEYPHFPSYTHVGN